MSHILLTGFDAFDGREVNASWIAAQALIAGHRSKHILHGLRIPVCWGGTTARSYRGIRSMAATLYHRNGRRCCWRI